MFCGKSTLLLRHLVQAEKIELRTLTLKPKTDTSVRGTHISTHDGQSRTCHLISDDVISLEGLIFHENPQAIFVDEVQFLSPKIMAKISEISLTRLVVMAGLAEDFRGKDFGALPEIIRGGKPLKILHLTAACARCGSPALHTQRLTQGKNQISPGGAEQYEPRCDECWSPQPPEGSVSWNV